MPIEPLCLDASYLIGLLDPLDVWHKDAGRIQVVLREHAVSTITPDCVMNEVLAAFARRCQDRREPEVFRTLAVRLMDAIPESAITWLYPHVPRWFGQCVAIMRETAGTVNFHDALLRVAAEEVGFRAIVSFDAGFDRAPGLQRLGSAKAVKAWARSAGGRER